MFFDHVVEASSDPIFDLKQDFLKDVRKEKVFLSIGVFQSDFSNFSMMDSVKRAMSTLEKWELPADYLPIDGDPLFLDEIGKLIFGESFYKDNLERIYKAQTIGGTSALRIGGENIFQEVDKKIFLTNPTWSNHNSIFEKIGFQVILLPYFDMEKKEIDFEKYYSKIESLPEKSVLLLHACCHNPTGSELTKAQWESLSDLMKRKKIFPFFDFAYQGFGKGVNEDAGAIRHFAEKGHELFVAYSCSKNFSLYQQRIGGLFFLGDSKEVAKKIGSHIKRSIRVNYSNPPSFGKILVMKVLKDPILRNRWLYDLEMVRKHLNNTRQKLSFMLSEAIDEDFSYLANQIGMFSLLNLTKEQIKELRVNFGIYMPSNGRINIAGITENNLNYVVSSISRVFKHL